jgi:rfaE bifunctional protein kinase chain/domain
LPKHCPIHYSFAKIVLWQRIQNVTDNIVTDLTSIDKTPLLDVISRLAGKRILIVGDVILDEYLIGNAARLSREAPIPVLEFAARRVIPGGAANPAMNVAALGGLATQVAVVGDDLAGQELIARLQEASIDASGIVVDPHRCTTQKTRIVSQGSLRFPQQLARIDRVDRHSPAPEVEAAVIRQIETTIPLVDAVLVSDYHNGLLTPPIVQATLAAANKSKSLLVVDSQGYLDKYKGYDIIRANDRDTAAYLARPLRTEDDFETAVADLLESLDARGIVIGRGAEGVSLRGRNTPYHHFPAANPSEVFDVTGAGDTSAAMLTLGIVAGLNLAQAALLANYAAGLVVRKLGNATPTPEELKNVVQAQA